MRFDRQTRKGIAEGDMTPMIDMTFQLIAFFMVLINFSEAEQNERIRLPSSELAKPPEAPLQQPITLQLTPEGTVLVGGEERTIQGLRPILIREGQLLEAAGHSPREATIVIRADRSAKAGKVQEVIQVCQETGFEKFVLRAKQSQSG
ncbi:MAG TPA: biopolymer transporter ExbD [Planctomycetaceae bacterium]|nr:biopolymer transporter ExbD [Planctomycetaceae bacterium]